MEQPSQLPNPNPWEGHGITQANPQDTSNKAQASIQAPPDTNVKAVSQPNDDAIGELARIVERMSVQLQEAQRAIAVSRQENAELARKHAQQVDRVHELANVLAGVQLDTGDGTAAPSAIIQHIHDWLTKHGMPVFQPKG